MTRDLKYMTPYGVVEELRKTDPELADVLLAGLKKEKEYANRLFREAGDLRQMMGLRIPLYFDGKREHGNIPIKFRAKGNRIPLRINKDRYPVPTSEDDPATELLNQILWTEEHIAQALQYTIELKTRINRYHQQYGNLSHTVNSLQDSLEILVDPERWGELDDAIQEYRQHCKEWLEEREKSQS